MRRLPTAVAFLSAGLLIAAPGTEGAEYYSWVDPSGVLVMTDDPSQIPSPTQRSPVEVHRFQDPASGGGIGAGPLRDIPAVHAEEAAGVPSRGESDPPPGLPNVLLAAPDDPVRSQYVWVPLHQPVPIGSEMVSGFWWHPGVNSSIDAFKAFLRQQHVLIGGGLWGPRGLPPGAPAAAQPLRSPNPVYDQVVRERQALIQRTFPHSPWTPHAPASGAGGAAARPHAKP